MAYNRGAKEEAAQEYIEKVVSLNRVSTVSYTHLTLPTNREV